MKLRRFLCALLFGLGCALSFIGFLSVILPNVGNPQLQLVLASFETPSSNAVVQRINELLSFAMKHNWRVVYAGLLLLGTGAALLLHFTPRRPNVQTSPPPAAARTGSVGAVNPYARAVYNAPSPANPHPSSSGIKFYNQPILDRNPIGNTQEPAENRPYFSPRLPAELQAMQAQSAAVSQSGSRILIRSVSASSDIPAESRGAQAQNFSDNRVSDSEN